MENPYSPNMMVWTILWYGLLMSGMITIFLWQTHLKYKETKKKHATFARAVISEIVLILIIVVIGLLLMGAF